MINRYSDSTTELHRTALSELDVLDALVESDGEKDSSSTSCAGSDESIDPSTIRNDRVDDL